MTARFQYAVSHIDPQTLIFAGVELRLPRHDRVLLDLLMLLEGGLGLMPVRTLCEKYGYRSTRSYYAKLALFEASGIHGLMHKQPGPKQPSRRTADAERRVVAVRVSCPSRSAAQIADLLVREGLVISTRTVERILSDFGLTGRS